MSKVNIEKAIRFVQNSQDPVLSALALYATGRIDTEQALDTIKVYQRDDGGWKTNYDDKHRVGFTAEALVVLKKVGHSPSPINRRLPGDLDQ